MGTPIPAVELDDLALGEVAAGGAGGGKTAVTVTCAAARQIARVCDDNHLQADAALPVPRR